MSAKPFRNSKGVNKPFRSPFSSTIQNKSNKNPLKASEQNGHELPLKIDISKKLLFQEIPSPKKLRLNDKDDGNQRNVDSKTELYYSDLESLKRKVKEKEKAIQNLKTTISYRKKNKAEDLENAIKQWTEVCQNALRDYQNDLQKRSDQPMAISEILASFNINPDVVRFSVENDVFY